MQNLTPEQIDHLFPVSGIVVHPNGAMTVERAAKYPPPPQSIGNKAKIKQLSRKSLRRLTHIMQSTDIKLGIMLTLTYGYFYPSDGKVVKRDLHYIKKTITKYCTSWLWFLEFQKVTRNAPHLHFLLSGHHITPAMRYDVADKWIKRQLGSDYVKDNVADNVHHRYVAKLWWANMQDGVWEIIRCEDGARRYVAKYASKQEQKNVPEWFENVGRFWGASKDIMATPGLRLDITKEELMQFLDDNNSKTASYDVLPRYIWDVPSNGGVK